LPGGNGRDSGIAGWENMEMEFKFQMGMGMGWNRNEVIEMGGNLYEKSVPAHLYFRLPSVIIPDTCETFSVKYESYKLI